jgi:hypothetical protein
LEEAEEGHCGILMVACVVEDGGDVFAMDDGLLARKQSPAYHDDAPQYCRVCGIFSIV